MNPEDLLVLVINLERSRERLAKMGAQLDRLGCVWQRLPAADGRNLSMDDPQLLYVAAFGRRQAAQSYADGLQPLGLPYDHAFDRAWAWKLRLRMVTPSPRAHNIAQVSVIHQAEMASRKFQWTRR